MNNLFTTKMKHHWTSSSWTDANKLCNSNLQTTIIQQQNFVWCFSLSICTAVFRFTV